jgi:zinc transporter ZupT
MTNLSLTASLILGVAEVAGAYLFYATKNAIWRRVLTAFGLGFAAAIVVFDILPDSTEHFPLGYALAALGALMTFAIWRVAGRARGATAGRPMNAVAVAGMALHNFCEGVVIAAMTGPLSFLFAAGVLLHKLPEGMATFALLGGEKDRRRLLWSAAVALAIPFGVLVKLPARYEQPVMATLAGMIFVAVATAIFDRREKTTDTPALAGRLAPYLAGGVIGFVSCLIA